MKSARFLIVLCVLGLIASVACAESYTVATFADPSQDSDNPLFTVDWNNSEVTGGWADGGDLLDLLVGGVSYDAWFEMDDLTIVGTQSFAGMTIGVTGAGQIRFYETGTTTNPLLTLDFGSLIVSPITIGANDLAGDNVTIGGSAVTGTLSDEQFSFAVVNVVGLSGGNIANDGFTGTASFTSSAVPEPATLALLGLGGLALLKKKRAA